VFTPKKTNSWLLDKSNEKTTLSNADRELLSRTDHRIPMKHKYCTYSFYTADNPDVLLVTEPGVTHIGSVVVESPDTSKGLDRDIEVSLCFSGTEVIATAWDATSGNMAYATLKFILTFRGGRHASKPIRPA